MRYVDHLDRGAREALLNRLHCHRNLALALQKFTPVFEAQRPLQLASAKIRSNLDAITGHLNDADRHWKRLKTPRGSSTNKALLLSDTG